MWAPGGHHEYVDEKHRISQRVLVSPGIRVTLGVELPLPLVIVRTSLGRGRAVMATWTPASVFELLQRLPFNVPEYQGRTGGNNVKVRKCFRLALRRYRVSAKVLLPHINLRTATTIAANLVPTYSKLAMRYTVKSVIAPPGGKQQS
ncbi:hypothetical protein AVEN_245700-1 [Araneus ventricosus]|uniref:Uncharacterized protein n=1 Tax=Araneus ventricosus TaxID=182803 RepID=A0A4Y2FNW6_ARAVE|nr:hypothetical protein AVEN_245700-1 [Araneus ventricosus]